MKNIIGSLVVSLVCAAGGQSAFAGNTCSPDVKVEYQGDGQGTSIKVVAFEYRLDGTSVWHREDVSNKVLDPKDRTHTFKSQRLGSTAKGQKIDLRTVFRKDTGSGFSSTESRGEIRDSNKECENNVTYSLIVK
jgi:hypothetical protein